MGIEANHPEYSNFMELVQLCDDCIEGSAAVKAAGIKYLPVLSGQVESWVINLSVGQDKGSSVFGSAYQSYKDRALFYNGARRTSQGLIGAATMLDPVITAPEAIKSEFEEFKELPREIIGELVNKGRVAGIVDAPQGGGDPFVVTYCAEDIVNWDCTKINGEEVLTLLVVEEKIPGPGSDRYSKKLIKQRREWAWDPITGVPGRTGRVTFRLWREPSADAMDKSSWEKREEHVLTTIGGKELDQIPGKLANACEMEVEIEPPPLTDLCNVNISHYQNSADLEEGRHWTAMPTATACGFDSTDDKGVAIQLKIGGGTVWRATDPQAKASYLEFSGAGLGHLTEGMKEKRDMMAVLGARILEEPKKSVESADSLAARYGGEKSALMNIIRVTRELVTWLARQKLEWMQPTSSRAEIEAAVHVELPTDLNVARLEPKDLVALFNVYIGGGISFATFIELLKRGEMLPRDRTPEDEEAAIAAGGPGQSQAFVTQPNPQDITASKVDQRVTASSANAKAPPRTPVGAGAYV